MLFTFSSQEIKFLRTVLDIKIAVVFHFITFCRSEPKFLEARYAYIAITEKYSDGKRELVSKIHNYS